ncbi:hypothetical protein RIR_jg23857.t1 [Rhizophagus irregularis DAOM 181602=DAOM 197198]|nr:hypothetical protein RIR_jg23857.t1 [Rhizophagus irregularis DAOM 181602=DAOM 197198]
MELQRSTSSWTLPKRKFKYILVILHQYFPINSFCCSESDEHCHKLILIEQPALLLFLPYFVRKKIPPFLTNLPPSSSTKASFVEELFNLFNKNCTYDSIIVNFVGFIVKDC